MHTRIVVEKQNEEIVKLPVLFALVALFIAPWLVAISAAWALLAGCTVRMEHPERVYVYNRSNDGASDNWHNM